MDINKLKNDPRMPKHLGLIIDGNGRWAKRRGLPRSMGHKFGFDNLKKQVEFVIDLGIKNLSIYCFSSENWNRPKDEVEYLMELFDKMLDDYKREYLDRDIRIIISGNLEDERIPKIVRDKAYELMEITKDKSGFILNPCINYGGRQEILKAVNEIIANDIKIVDERILENHLYTSDCLPLDYIIRTSGEERLSNFMPWQSTYSEFYFPKVTWPSFTKRHMIKALKVFMRRNRRFGAIKG